MDPTEIALYVGVDFGGQYRTVEYLGGGNFSGVFRAIDLSDQREVAVKVLSALHQDQEAIEEFETEGRLLGLLASCSNIVGIYDDGQHSFALTTPQGSSVHFDTRFMVLECALTSLETLLLDRQQLRWADRLEIFREVTLGMHQMHQRHVVHRDGKSSNVLIWDSEPTAKICDLGRSVDVSNPPRFHPLAYEAGRGDLRFAPPEFLWMLGTTDPIAQLRADLYLVGSLFYEITTGVGLTAAVFGDTSRIRAHAQSLSPAARSANFNAYLGRMREMYHAAYSSFTAEIPTPIRQSATWLLSQLTDPDPTRREPPFRVLENLPGRWDLQWILRRIDTMGAALRRAEAARVRTPWRKATRQ